ncbi:MAG: hypothetical protein ACC726_09310, partial [Chloroflexota bacterium]
MNGRESAADEQWSDADRLTVDDDAWLSAPLPSLDNVGSPIALGRYTHYRLVTVDGTHVATHVRHDGPDGKKRMWWRSPDGSSGL